MWAGQQTRADGMLSGYGQNIYPLPRQVRYEILDISRESCVSPYEW